MTRVRLVVLDVGGTTIRDTADVAAVFDSVLQGHGISTARGQVHQWRGASKREVIENLVMARPGATLDPAAVYRTFQQSLIEAFTTQGVQAIPGVEMAIRRLRAHQIRVVLATGFDAPVMGVVLERLGWNQALDGVVTADDVPRGRPAPDVVFAAMRQVDLATAEAVVTVGDTVNDLRAAEAAGVGASIGVLTGAHHREQLAAVPHTAILASAAEVAGWLADRHWSTG